MASRTDYMNVDSGQNKRKRDDERMSRSTPEPTDRTNKTGAPVETPAPSIEDLGSTAHSITTPPAPQTEGRPLPAGQSDTLMSKSLGNNNSSDDSIYVLQSTDSREPLIGEHEPPRAIYKMRAGREFYGCKPVTIAKIKRGITVQYVNRYGSKGFPWLVFSNKLGELEAGMTIDKLPDLANKDHRVLDHPRAKGTPKPGLTDIDCINELVWATDKTLDLNAVELLNPGKVKSDGVKQARFPTTYMAIQFKGDLNNVELQNWPKDLPRGVTNFEISSTYKALHSRRHEASQAIYEAALNQRARFIDYLKAKDRWPSGGQAIQPADGLSLPMDRDTAPLSLRDQVTASKSGDEGYKSMSPEPASTGEALFTEEEVREDILKAFLLERNMTSLDKKGNVRFGMFWNDLKKNGTVQKRMQGIS